MSMAASVTSISGFDDHCPGRQAVNEEILRGLKRMAGEPDDTPA